MPEHPQLTNNYAFFDVDDTVISVKSMFSFIRQYFTTYPNAPLEKQFNQEMDKLIASNTDWNTANKIYYSYFRHFPVSTIELASQQWFTQVSSDKTTFYCQNVLQHLKKHQEEGTQCVFVSGSFKELLQPIADDLHIKHILSINLERQGNTFTGNIIPPQTIGEGKVAAITSFLDIKQADARECFAYGDDISDAPMLALVGYPKVIAGGRGLEQHAEKVGWPVIQPF